MDTNRGGMSWVGDSAGEGVVINVDSYNKMGDSCQFRRIVASLLGFTQN